MFSKLKLNKKILNTFKKNIFTTLQIVLKKKFTKFDNTFFKIIKNNKIRAKVFDCINMHVELCNLNFLIYTLIKKKIKKDLVTWTYPQIRLDGKFAFKYSAPLHKDEWILDHNKNGYVVWFPISENGGSILISRDNKTNIHVKDNYWGIRSKDKKKLDKIFLKYGEAIIFSHNLLHKSETNENRVTVQLRYEEINHKFKERSVTQKTNPVVLEYWKKKLL